MINKEQREGSLMAPDSEALDQSVIEKKKFKDENKVGELQRN